MQTKLANDSSRERYVVEIDGITKSEYSVFVKALTASLQLKHDFPHSSVKLRDADDVSGGSALGGIQAGGRGRAMSRSG